MWQKTLPRVCVAISLHTYPYKYERMFIFFSVWLPLQSIENSFKNFIYFIFIFYLFSGSQKIDIYLPRAQLEIQQLNMYYV